MIASAAVGPPRVYVIDDDESVRGSLVRLLRSSGMAALAFKSAEDFLLSDPELRNACIVADACVSGIGGLELQKRLSASQATVPIIFLAVGDNAESRRQAGLAKAAAYFSKPVDGQALLDSIAWALSNAAPENALGTKRAVSPGPGSARASWRENGS